jgi:hypothetical protein
MRLSILVCIAALALGCQPRDERPGMWVRGEPVEQRVDDWSFTGEVDEIFIETRSWYGLPHSTTIWCVEHDGRLFIGSYGNEKKAWEENVARRPEAKLAIQGRTYAVTVTPVTDPDLSEALDARYARKYDMREVFGEALPDWWYYEVTQ